MPYKYVKAPPGYTLKRALPIKAKLRLTLSALLLTTGVTALTSVAYPLVVYQIEYAPSFVAQKSPPSTPAVPRSPSPATPTFVKEMINTTFDYTDSNLWFPTAAASNTAPVLEAYTLSIPKLGIEEASVRNDHTDLKKTLIQYPGTASPGDLGNTVIFGHSVLPQFFNPHNYITIFSTLHTLSPGDELIIKMSDVTYTYRISEMYSVEPSDLSPLAQSYDRHRLTLITCTPPGTYLKRLIVKADLI